MIKNKTVLVVIPARMGGYRFPDKPLRRLLGKPMLQWVWENARTSRYADDIAVATPDQAIADAVAKFGAASIMTSPAHRRGTERVWEAAQASGKKWDIIVNFQGDEPLVTGAVLDRAIEELERNADVACVNLFRWMEYDEAEQDQNEVKVVINTQGNAMYFSRNPLPAKWLGDKQFRCRAEICVMPMWSWAIEQFVKLGNAYYEEIESVDMMRFVENDMKVRMIECPIPVKSVDCEEDLLDAERLLAAATSG